MMKVTKDDIDRYLQYDDELQAIRARAENAAHTACSRFDTQHPYHTMTQYKDGRVYITCACTSKSDLLFIARAREDVLRLIERIAEIKKGMEIYRSLDK